MRISSGKLRHRIRLEEYAYLLDSNGDVIQDDATGETSRAWTLVAELWAAIEPLSGREFIAAQATQSKVTARITIRYRAGVVASMRIVHNGRIYNVEGVLADKDSGLEFLTMPCSEGLTQGQ